jgi:hypothetical protein
VRRVDPVAGFEPVDACASRHGAQRLSPARNRAGRSPAPHTRARTTTASPGRKSPRSSSASRRPPLRLGWPTAKHGARGGVRWPQPCLKHARPRLARRAQPPEVKGATQGGVAAQPFPAQETPGSTTGATSGPRTATAGTGAWVAREHHTVAGRQSCGSMARTQARSPDGVPQRRRFNTEKKSRRGKR